MTQQIIRPVPLWIKMLGTPMHFTSLDGLVPFAKARAARFLYDGKMDAYNRAIIDACFTFFDHSPEACVAIIFTRDVGHHEGGWWKNPDYERCWHLSLSHRAIPADAPIEPNLRMNERLARAFFGDDAKLSWIEGPFTPEGKQRGVFHYRVFCDEGWQALKPRGEVYSRENTPADWRSFSEIHGYSPAAEDAPFLKKASE